MLPFKVNKKYQRGTEQLVAKFQEASEAKSFIQMKLEQDAGLRLDVTYALYDFDDLMEEFTQAALNASGTNQGQSSGQANTSSFSPSPFQAAPRPGGMPASSFKDLLQGKDEDTK